VELVMFNEDQFNDLKKIQIWLPALSKSTDLQKSSPLSLIIAIILLRR
jgi:hypothetical protein